MTDPYAAAAASAEQLAKLTGFDSHDIAVVLGSGWAPAADALGSPDAVVPVAELGAFPEPTVPGHVPAVRTVRTGSRRVLVFLGRAHLYEGHQVAAVVHGVRTAIAAGCRVIVLTNAAGGIRRGLRPGQPVLISDHINLTGRSPVAGPPPPDGYPSRFTDLSEGILREAACGRQSRRPEFGGGRVRRACRPALRDPGRDPDASRAAGADLVGMSTVLETIAARHLGAEVLGLSLVTNLAAGLSDQPLDHGEVVAAGQHAALRMGTLLAEILPMLL